MDLGFLRRLYDGMGDYVSVYLDTDRIHEGNNSEATQIRWDDARRELAAAGADEISLDAVAELVGDRDEVAPGRAMFARNGAVVFTGALDAPPRREIARFAALPHLMPLLAQHRPPIPHVRVSATRTGGEVVAIGGSGDVWRDWMSGRQWPVHKVKVGGWSQDKIQRRAEETWEENAKELAAEVIAAADRVGARHVIISGDVRVRTMLLEHLSVPLRESSALVDKEVTADSSAMADAANKALSDWADRDRRARFEDWGTYLAHDQAVQGLAQTLTALRNGQVADVFVADNPHSTATAWIGPGGADVAATREELAARGVAEPVGDRADAAIVRAIATTEAELHFLPEDLVVGGDPAACGGVARPLDGIGATLRFPHLVTG
ncbi:MAG TPA: Vms1/Ankzf1 family peptidyl-tRNA hydrolase [Streptosporangiaceae bacterium]|nr:Vms1/Ankzf1 family peptidyl-tRNA hydrolase [Streptosporangiaceae bacterium]